MVLLAITFTPEDAGGGWMIIVIGGGMFIPPLFNCKGEPRLLLCCWGEGMKGGRELTDGLYEGSCCC